MMHRHNFMDELKSMYESSLSKIDDIIKWEFDCLFPHFKTMVKHYDEKKEIEHKLHHLNRALGVTEELEDDDE